MNSTTSSLTGNSGANTLRGGDGNDSLDGGAGADTLIGGLGQDTLTGGNGNDIFKYLSLAEIGNNYSFETIIDFTNGDKINLTALDSNANSAGDQAFSFVDSTAFSGLAGELRYQDGLLQGDVNGDFVFDFAIQLVGSPALAAGDFFL